MKNWLWIDWRIRTVSIWNNPHISAFKFWQGVYAAYGGIFVVMAIVWGLVIDKKRPDRYEIIGGFIVLIGASIIFYYPR